MSLEIQKNVPLSAHTTLGVGGEASFFTSVTSEEELEEAIQWARSKSLGFFILGEGSNTLAPDEGFVGLLIHLCIKGIALATEGQTVLLSAKAGEILDDVVERSVQEGWWGMENLSHIPGTIGATPVQNVGAYGVEVSDIIKSVRVLDTETMQYAVLQNAECAFAYRDSIFKKDAGKKYVVTEVVFELSLEPMPKVEYKDLANYFNGVSPSQGEIRTAVIVIRSEKFPNWREIGTAGSFFKNPIVTTEVFNALRVEHPDLPGYLVDEKFVKLSLAWILDRVLHLRGHSEGPVSTYERQALVLTAERGATALQIESFANAIIEKIKDEMGIEVDWEVTKLK